MWTKNGTVMAREKKENATAFKLRSIEEVEYWRRRVVENTETRDRKRRPVEEKSTQADVISKRAQSVTDKYGLQKFQHTHSSSKK